jgi:hypothetical protein
VAWDFDCLFLENSWEHADARHFSCVHRRSSWMKVPDTIFDKVSQTSQSYSAAD